MGEVRLLVGTAKGLFILRSDPARDRWSIDGPHFGGWNVTAAKSSPIDPDRIWVSAWTDWHGQVVHRSTDGGRTWETVGNDFAYAGETGTHQWYDGTPHPWDFKRVWHFEPSAFDVDTVYAGVEDAAIFRTTDGGDSWHELPGLRTHTTGGIWQPGAGGLCLHTIVQDPGREGRLYVAISAAGAFRTDDGGETWSVITNGLSSLYIPDPNAEVGHCVHRIALHPDRPDTLYMQKHWDVCRSDDAGDNWREVSGNLSTDFGFPIVVNTNDPDTVYVVPIQSDAEHFPPDGKLRVWRSRTGGNEWEELADGLPEADFYQNVLRGAMSVDSLDPCGIYFGTTGGHVYGSRDDGDHWAKLTDGLPRVLCVEASVGG